MSNGAQMLQTLRDHRPLLLACEAIGWLHMTGKAHPDFLRCHGGACVDYDDLGWLNTVSPPFPWDDKLSWLLNQNTPWHVHLSSHWPGTLTEFISKHRDRDAGILGLLQASHAMASGVEKNIPRNISYLNQDAIHMWLVSPFGHPVRNLLSDPPTLLQRGEWDRLVGRIRDLLEELARLARTSAGDLQSWWDWRERAIGAAGWLRLAFLSTLAETRLPNNDVTLWDQSYVAGALFKSAVAAAALAGLNGSFKWDKNLKQQTRWRVLTVGLGTRHYEARAVKIGDWVGARRDIESFFEEARKLIEVDLAVGSLVYRDDEALIFTFPGQRKDESGGLDDKAAKRLKEEIATEIDRFAECHQLETPPVCLLSPSTRSFVPMVSELRKARCELTIPRHRSWRVPDGVVTGSGARHVCPVCLVRLNEPPASVGTDNARRSYPCAVCSRRRKGRLNEWLAGGADTIWISEVADGNDRVALLTFSLHLEPWLEASYGDSLRAQSIAEWRRFNPVLGGDPNPVEEDRPFPSLVETLEGNLRSPKLDPDDAVLSSLQEGYKVEAKKGTSWKDYFALVVEDRQAGEVEWSAADPKQNARWLAHQFFLKLPSPGRVHRFWRTTEGFFDELLVRFREIASAHVNRWRTRRLLLRPVQGTMSDAWEDRETYLGRWRGAPFEVVYLRDRHTFITICNLARCFKPEEKEDTVRESPILLKGDDQQEAQLQVMSTSCPENIGAYAPIILLDRSPQRFRVMVPLDRATACVEAAIMKWREEFARVWDRLPLRVGIVAFPRQTPFQAVIEAARNLEEELRGQKTETWRVLECSTKEGVTALSLERHGDREVVLVPTQLADGRDDVFYPYVRVEDREPRMPRDFQHPKGHVYRHMADLGPGDGVLVDASRVGTVYLDTTASRFEPLRVRPLGDFGRMRDVWRLLVRHAPSLTALRGAWFEIGERSRAWRDPEGRWLPGAEAQWLHLARAILRDRLGISGATLDTLVEAAKRGALEWALEWHLTWLKEVPKGAST